MPDEAGKGGVSQGTPTVEAGAGGADSLLGTSTQELSNSNAETWTAPALARSLGSTSNRVCFLNKVQGRLDSDGHYVRVYPADSSWYVGGNSPTAEMSATGRCASRTADNALSEESTWTAGQSLPTNMGPTTGRVCFVTRINGGFNSDSDWVRVYASGGSWFIFGASQTPGTFVRARCVSVPSYSGEYAWTRGTPQAEHMGTTSGRVCALTGLQGAFDGLGDFARIYTSAGSWYLDGSGKPAVARARCF